MYLESITEASMHLYMDAIGPWFCWAAVDTLSRIDFKLENLQSTCELNYLLLVLDISVPLEAIRPQNFPYLWGQQTENQRKWYTTVRQDGCLRFDPLEGGASWNTSCVSYWAQSLRSYGQKKTAKLK